MKKIFIDGSEGTTGLRIFERFEGRDDIEILKIPSELRKDPDEIKKYINASDITFLCLPDAAAREAVAMVENENTPPRRTERRKAGRMVIRSFHRRTGKQLKPENGLPFPGAMRQDLLQLPTPWLQKKCSPRIIRWRHLRCRVTAEPEKRRLQSMKRRSAIKSWTRRENTRLRRTIST